MELPPELICEILYYLSDKEYLHCYRSSNYFQVFTNMDHEFRLMPVCTLFLLDDDNSPYDDDSTDESLVCYF